MVSPLLCDCAVHVKEKMHNNQAPQNLKQLSSPVESMVVVSVE